MNIFLIRHGETEANLKEGVEPVLTNKGKKQAQKLAESIDEKNIDFLITSDLERAYSTAKEIIKLKPDTEFVSTPDLREIYRLIIGGPPKENTSKDRFEKDLQTAEKIWNRLLDYNYDDIAVVSHGNLIRFFISKALGCSSESLKNFYKLEIHPASVSKIFFDKNTKEIKIVFINDISHIPEELITENTIYI